MHTILTRLGEPDLPLRAFRPQGKVLSILCGKSDAPDPPNYQAAAVAEGAANKEAALVTAGMNRPNEVTPWGSRTWSLKPGADPLNPKPGDWVVNTNLSPAQQQLLNLESQNKLAYGQLANAGTDIVRDTLGKPFNIDALPDSPDYGQLPMGADAFENDRRRVEDALYNRTTRFYDDRFNREEAAVRDRLVNQGLDENSEAFQRQLLDFRRTKDESYADAADRAVLAGGGEQTREMAGLLQALAAQQGARDSAMQEQAYFRSLPLNEVNALRTGAQIQAPSFQAYQPATPFQGPQILDATTQGYMAEAQKTSANNAASAGTAQTAGSLAALGYLAFMASDRRLKSNIVEVGEGFRGLKVYEYDIFDRRERGYMADEVEAVAPEAVMTDDNGWQRVCYDMIGGRPE